MLLVQDIKVALGNPLDRLDVTAARRIHIDPSAIETLVVHRRSLDCRHTGVSWRYSVLIEVSPEVKAELLQRVPNLVSDYTPPVAEPVQPGSEPMPHPPVVVGCGPAGLFAALELARAGYAPILIERGKPVDARRADVDRFVTQRDFNPESNTVFGEGGAGAFSDGKLTSRSRDPLTQQVLQTLVDHGAPEDILIDSRAHVGTDRLTPIISSMREEILRLGGSVRFESKLEDIELVDGRVKSITVSGNRIEAAVLVLATGSHAEDVFEMLNHRGVQLASRAFQVGLRIEHPQSMIDQATYGRDAGHPELPPASYVLVGKVSPVHVFSFCMCPGGEMMYAGNEAGRMVTNGMSYHDRAGHYANSALMHSMEPKGDHPLAGLTMRAMLERSAWSAGGGDFAAVGQRVPDFLRRQATATPMESSWWFDLTPGSVAEYMPGYYCKALSAALNQFAHKIKGFTSGDGVLLGLDSRGSCPVRVVRDEAMQSTSTEGLYPTGEGAGYAGGIVSSAADALRTARAIIARHAPAR